MGRVVDATVSVASTEAVANRNKHVGQLVQTSAIVVDVFKRFAGQSVPAVVVVLDAV
jgi:hypothetical protein